MAVPLHKIHVYQRPKQGTAFVRSHPTFNYQHTISNLGWFDTASCDIAVRSEGEGLDILDTYLGCFVAIYVDNPAQPIWEGLINRITVNAGATSYSMSLDEMANRVTVALTSGANTGVQTADANDLNSQAIYGIKHVQIQMGGSPTGGTDTQRSLLRDTILAQRAFPQTSVSQAQGQTNLVHLELIGIFHTLEWESLYTALVGTTAAFNTAISGHITALGNSTTFFNNADTSQIVANAGTTPNQQRGQSIWERIMKIAESGDATNYWVCGIKPTNRSTGKRVFYYQQANAAVNYVAFQRDGLKPRNTFGQPIAPWLITPDQAIRVNDIAVGFNQSTSFDPRETYIKSIQYDANSQKVQWFGDDNTTARAAFLLNRGFKPQSRAFGAPAIQIVT